MVDAADDPFEQLMEFEPGQEMGSAATSWEDTFGPAREPQLMPDERNAISPVFDDPSQQLLDDQARRAYRPQPTPTMRLRVTSMQVRVTRGLPVKPSAAKEVPDPRNCSPALRSYLYTRMATWSSPEFPPERVGTGQRSR